MDFKYIPVDPNNEQPAVRRFNIVFAPHTLHDCDKKLNMFISCFCMFVLSFSSNRGENKLNLKNNTKLFG